MFNLKLPQAPKQSEHKDFYSSSTDIDKLLSTGEKKYTTKIQD